ncbi:MAG: threonine/serine dehydratase [Acidobacteria bacterium]|jgi:threonine dehydratase|nr:threonine/serine dehydratase [Acidobacteriota bacterium]
MKPPTFTDILRAKQTVSRYLPRTPLVNYPALDKICGTRVLVKHENQQLTGAFKVRGGINLISQLSDEERERGVISASTGNHGQSVAYAAKLFGTRAVIVVPENSNPLKVAAIRDFGAEVIFCGADFDAARQHCATLANRENLRYIHSANEPLLIAGVATVPLEILEDAPEVTTIIVPVGGGSGASAACLVAKTLNPQIQVIGVQAECAPAAYKSWRGRELLEDKMETAAEGLATRVAFELTQQILWQHLADFVLVGEEEIRQAITLYVEKAHTLAEGAGAASLAAALKLRKRLAGQTVALVLSGGNITVEQLRAALASL